MLTVQGRCMSATGTPEHRQHVFNAREDAAMSDWLTITEGQAPIIATAIHDGHELRSDVAALTALSDSERLQEEDPFTATWTMVVNTRVLTSRSRFEVDLNRPRDKAVYVTPEDAWGLQVWRNEPPEDMVTRSLEQYDYFYSEMHRVLARLQERYGKFVVLDLHSYNHRRGGPDAPPDDPKDNPEVNVGTGSMDRERWGSLVDRFMADLREFDFLGRRLDVRENVKFQGGNLPQWVHENFPASGCCLAIEFKKFFMNEWTGEPVMEELEAIPQSLEATLTGLINSLMAAGET